MMAVTHRLGGIAAGTLTATLLQADIKTSGIIIAASLLGSILPDIDNSHSSISRKIPLLSLLVSAGQGIIRLLACLFPRKQKNYICSLIGHRGLTHSLAAALILPLIVFFLLYISYGTLLALEISLGFCAGIISHELFDMLAGGVPLFMPFSTKRICIARIKTGGMVEWIFRIGFISFLILIGWEIINA